MPSAQNVRPKVLVTGAGGPAAVSFIKAIPDGEMVLYTADMDPYACGLYFAPKERRAIIPAGASPDFVLHMLNYCRSQSIDVLVPTVDSELLPLARARSEFEAAGVRLLLASETTLASCLDKLQLLDVCSGIVPVPQYAAFDDSFIPVGWKYPLIIKPRTGSGSRGIRLIGSLDELHSVPRSEHMLVQDFLPGAEYSVDVLASGSGEIVAAVPRARMKVDSGIAVTSRTVHDEQLETFARHVATAIGLTYTANVQFRRTAEGVPALLEVNARFPGTMSLTVRSGINMPLLSLRDVLGESAGHAPGAFEDIAMVRYWEEKYIAPAEIDALRGDLAVSR